MASILDGIDLDYKAIKPKATAGDVAKQVGASAIEGIGYGFQAGGELVAAGVNKVAGTDLRAVNPLQAPVDSIRNTISAGGQVAMRDTPSGDLFKPDTWKMPESGSGYAMTLAQGLGSAASTVLPVAGVLGKGKTAAMAVGAVSGGAQAGGAAASDTRKEFADTYQNMNDEQLQQELPAYQELRAQGMDEAKARSTLVNRGALYSTVGAGTLGTLSGIAGGALMSRFVGGQGLPAAMGGAINNRAGQAAAGLVTGAVGEGTQEVVENMSATGARNLAYGRPVGTDITEDTFADFAAGALTGGAVSGGMGALSKPQAGPDVQPIPTEDNPAPVPVERPDPSAGALSRAAAQLPAPEPVLALPAPEQSVYVDSNGVAQDVGPVRNVDGTMQPAAQGLPPVSAGLRNNPGLDQPVASGERPNTVPAEEQRRIDRLDVAQREQERADRLAAAFVDKVNIEAANAIAERRAANLPEPQHTIPPGLDLADKQGHGRWHAEVYRNGVEGLVSQLTVGGDVAYVRDQHDRIVSRTASINPMWWQDMDTSVKPGSVEKAKAIVQKALKGEKLGPKQARFIATMLDMVDDLRVDPQQAEQNRAILEEIEWAAGGEAARNQSDYQRGAGRGHEVTPQDDAELHAYLDGQVEPFSLNDLTPEDIESIKRELILLDDTTEATRRAGDINDGDSNGIISRAIETGREVPAQQGLPRGQRDNQEDGAAVPAGDSELLTSYTEEELAERERARLEAEQAANAEQTRQSQRTQADAERDAFSLTGSDRIADVGAAAGQNDLLAPPPATVAADQSPALVDQDRADAENKAPARSDSTAPEHRGVGVDNRELAEIVVEFKDRHSESIVDGDQIHHLFDAPAKNEIVRLQDKAKVYTKDHGWMTPAEAKARVAEWKKRTRSQGDTHRIENSQRVVLSFFDLTGKWSQPWEEAGYQVYRFDIQDDPEVGDVNNFSTEFFNDWFGSFEGNDIYAILAACPCTDFASSGARHFAAKDKDGRTVASVRLVQQTLAAIEYFKPAIWAVENPVGRIEKLGGLPPWRLSFDPNHIGDPYTKKTLLWGRFNADMPIAPVEPTEGSKMHKLYGGKSLATKNARSATPEGFSYGFFMANNAVDHPAMALANKFDRLDGDLIGQALNAGVTEDAITEAVEDFYYMDLDDAAANDAIRDLIEEQGDPSPGSRSTDSLAEDVAAAILSGGGTEADANRAATDLLIERMSVDPSISVSQDAPKAVKAAQARIQAAPDSSAPQRALSSIDTYNNLRKQQPGRIETVKGWQVFDLSLPGLDQFALWRKTKELNAAGGGYVGAERVASFDSRDEARAWAQRNPAAGAAPSAEQSISSQLANMDEAALSALIDDVTSETAAPQTSKPKAKRSTKAKTATGKPRIRKTATKAERTDVQDAGEVTRTAGEIAKSMGVNMSHAGMNALEGLTKLFGGPGRLNSGLSFDEETYAKAKPYFKAAMADIQAAGKDLRDFVRALVGQFGDGVKPYIIRYAQDLKEEQDNGGANRSLESDSTDNAEQDAAADSIDEGSGEVGPGTGPVGSGQGRGRSNAQAGVSGDSAATDRERGNQSLDREEPAVEGSDAGSADRGRGRPSSTGGLYAGRDHDGAADRATETAVAPQQAKVLPSTKPGTVSEIRQQMPFLTDGQAEDVVFAEKRLSKPEGYGVLYTNGTGTGKTFTGLGVMARAAANGKDSILVVVPKQPIADAWVAAGAKFFGLNIKQLDSTQDNGGSGVVVTTYANLSANNSLALRDWDMVVADEAHYLSSAEDGRSTRALENLRALTRRRGSEHTRNQMKHSDLVEQRRVLGEQAKLNRTSDDERYWPIAEQQEAEAKKISRQLEAYAEQEKAALAAMAPADKPRGLFLSATPFAYEKNVVWAQEFLFDWGENDGSQQSYNSGSSFERFMMQHFGYRMRYNKLTAPDAKVDSGLMQRAFNAWLKRDGALSSRALDSQFDYDRLFVTVESPIGRRVDEALKWLWDQSGNDKHESEDLAHAFRELNERISKESFNYHARMYFLEAIKAKEALPHIRAQLAAGRKVLVMHDFKKGGAINPFRLSPGDGMARQAYQQFTDAFPDLIRAFDYLPSPIDQLSSAFPDALVYNGNVSSKNRIAMQNQFNDDADGAPRLMIAQGDAMREGVSIHDTTGKFPRVLVHLGMPVKPTAAIQQEGRIYRTGQASNAMFRYFTIGTSWERTAFASKIAGRAGTAENLAMGEQARGLKQAFISAYENADLHEPGFEGEGLGGKADDQAAAAALTPWDMAKSFYFGTKKQGKGRSSRGREGTDYFATPEPVGLKMVEWADIRGGESVLEPSAGHGAIARWFPETAKARVIEQSAELASRVALHVDGDVVQGDFEDHNIVNKYDGIVMNPPYGFGGATAIAHLSKAANHLREGGRVVALIPTGPAADKKFDNWLYGQDAKGKLLHPDLHMIADVKMPSVTFERAGTAVATRVVVIERAGEELARSIRPAVTIGLESVESIEELFNRLENIDLPARAKPLEEEVEQTAPAKSVAPKQSYAEKKAEEVGDKYISDAPIIEHITAKGKTLRGIIVRDMSVQEVKDRFYPYAFKKDGGVFLREEFIQRPDAVQEPGEAYGAVGEREASAVQERKRRQHIPNEAQGMLDLFAPADIPAPAAVQQARDNFALRYIHEEVGQLRTGFDTITTPEQAAHLFAPIRKHAQETLMLAVTDADDKVLSVIRHSKGLKDQASAAPGDMAAAVAATPGAAKVWVAHNHPGGVPDPSDADFNIDKLLRKALDGTGIELAGSLTVAPGGTSHLYSSKGKVTQALKIEPARRMARVAVTERVLRKRMPLNPARRVTSPLLARAAIGRTKADNALLLLTSQHDLIGALNLTPAEMKGIREGDVARRILSAIDSTNAVAAIIKTGDESAAENLSKFLNNGNYVRILDWIQPDGASDAERGSRVTGATGAFFKRAPQESADAGFIGGRAVKELAIRKMGKDTVARRFRFVDYAELPAQIKKAATDQGAKPEEVRAVHWRGMTYMVNGRFSSEADAARAMFHEHYVHFGLRAKYGKGLRMQLGKLLSGVGGLKGVRELSVKQGIDLSDYAKGLMRSPGVSREDASIVLMEELMAHMGETTGTLRRIVEEFVGMVRAWLRNNGHAELATLGVTDLAYELRGARQAAIAAAKADRAGTPMFRREPERAASPVQPARPVNTKAFRDWFKNSKIVDEQGAPLVVYHGTRADFDAFETQRAGSTDEGWYGRGIYTTAAPELASAYAGNKDGSNVLPLYVTLQNPYYWPKGRPAAIGAEAATALTEELQAQGYDGVVVSNDFNDTPLEQRFAEIVVFQPSQVKSASGNRGTYDPDNADIRFSRAPAVDSEAFKRWFGDSKVVDDDGKPLVVYRGLGAPYDQGAGREITWVTPDAEYASEYAKGNATLVTDNGRFYEAGANVLPLYVSIKRPFDLGFRSTMTSVKYSDVLDRIDGGVQSAFEREVIGRDDAIALIREIRALKKRDTGEFKKVHEWWNQNAEQVKGLLERAGYDGLKSREGFDDRIPAFGAFRPEQIKSAIGNNGNFDPDNADIRFSLGARGEAITDEALRKLGLKPEAAQSLKDKIAAMTTGDLRNLLRDWGKRAEEGIFDGLNGIKKAEQAVGVTDPNQQGYVSARLATGLADVMHAVMHFGAPEWQDGIIGARDNTRGLLDILGDLGQDNLTDWLGWLGGKRAQMLKSQGRENNLSDPEIAELLELGQGKEALFERVYREYAKINEAVLDVAQEAGLLTADNRAKWATEYYVPFYRVTEEGLFLAPRGKKGLSHQTAGIKALKGGKVPTNDLLENILTNWTKRIDASLKNKALIEVVDNLKGSEYLTDESIRYTQAIIPRAEIAKRIRKDRKTLAAVSDLLGMPEGSTAIKVAGELMKPENEGFEKIWAVTAPTDPDIIRVQRDGGNEYYKVNDESLLRGLKHIEGSVFNDPITRIGRAFKRLLTTGVTASPDFILRNFIRDAAHAWVINKDGFTLGKDSMKGLRQAFAEDSDYRDMMFAGSSFQGGYVHGSDPEAAAQIIRRALEKKGMSQAARDRHMASLVTSPAQMAGLLSQGWQKYRGVGDKIENANRLATYKAAIAAGKSKRQAAYEAKDLMDYSLRGNFAAAQWFTDVVPFLNARLQGLYKLGRAAKGDTSLIAKEVAIKGGYLAAFSLMLAAMNSDDERYKALPEWDKDMHWHVFLGDEHFRIPKPFELGIVFGTIPERMLHAMTGNQTGEQLTGAVARGFFETLAFNPVPQFYQPIREVQANRDFFRDRPIEGMADEGKLAEARYDHRTSALGKAIGQVTGPIAGLSPKQVDHLIQGYTGTLGGYVLSMSTLIADMGTPGEAPDRRISDLPVAKVLYSGSDPRSTQYHTDFYDMLGEADQIYRTVRSYREEGRMEAAAELMAKEGDKLKHRRALGMARQQFGAVRKRMTAIYRDPNMGGEEKRRQLNELQERSNAIAERMVRMAKADF